MSVPFNHLDDTEAFQAICSGERLERVEGCPPDVYVMLLEMWQMDPARRPLFPEVLVLFFASFYPSLCFVFVKISCFNFLFLSFFYFASFCSFHFWSRVL